MTSFNLGRFAIPVLAVVFIAAVLVALAVGNRLARRKLVVAEPALWLVLGVGLACARLAVVVEYWRYFERAPLTILDFRDGGFSLVAGLAGGLAAALAVGVVRQRLRAPLAASFATFLTLWAGGSGALALSEKQVRLPAVQVADLQGRAVDTASFAGRPVVINMWASWCPPCREEMPDFQEAQQANPDVVFLFANQGETPDVVEGFIASAGLRLDNVLVDPDHVVARATGALALPTTLFFDASGRLVKSRVGMLSPAMLAQWSEAARQGQR